MQLHFATEVTYKLGQRFCCVLAIHIYRKWNNNQLEKQMQVYTPIKLMLLE